MADFPSLASAIWQALTLDEQIFVTVEGTRQGLWIALIVVALAGLSQAFGQSLVLFINQVRPRRFILAIIASTIGGRARGTVRRAAVGRRCANPQRATYLYPLKSQ